VRFETRVFRNRTGRTVEGHDRAAFQRAYAINPREAVNSTSWGWFQVMGFHGFPEMYGGPAEAVRAFDADPEAVGIRLFKRWMSGSSRAEQAKAAARRLDFATFASIYNGCSLDPNASHPCTTYQTRMRAAYERALRGELTVRRAAAEAAAEAGAEAGAAVAAHPVAMSMAAIAGVVTVAAAGAFVWWAYKRSRGVRRNRRRRRRSRSSGSLQPNAEPTDPALYSRIQRSVRESVKRWPSAYASGLVVQRYKAAGGEYEGRTRREGGLAKWFAEKWVDVCDPSLPPCGRATSGMSEREYRKKYPKCRPLAVAKKMSAPERAAACARKRRAVSKAGPRVVWVRN
jgi:hypothetical protein